MTDCPRQWSSAPNLERDVVLANAPTGGSARLAAGLLPGSQPPAMPPDEPAAPPPERRYLLLNPMTTAMMAPMMISPTAARMAEPALKAITRRNVAATSRRGQ